MKIRLMSAAILVALPFAAFSQVNVIGANSPDGVDSPFGPIIMTATKKAEPLMQAPDAVDSPMYECIYSYKINAQVPETYTTILQMGEQMAKFSDYAAYSADSIAIVPDADPEEIMAKDKQRFSAMFCFDGEVYQDYPAGSMTVVQEVVPTLMSYTEPMGAFEWQLDETSSDTICGYQCNKATTVYGGREWTVWYAPDIPVTAGPWKFNGLPGLVMKATDGEGLHEFEAISLRQGVMPIVRHKDVTIVSSARDKVIKAKANIEEKGLEGILPESITSITVMKNSGDKPNFIINGVALRERPSGYHPLELK